MHVIQLAMPVVLMYLSDENFMTIKIIVASNVYPPTQVLLYCLLSAYYFS